MAVQKPVVEKYGLNGSTLKFTFNINYSWSYSTSGSHMAVSVSNLVLNSGTFLKAGKTTISFNTSTGSSSLMPGNGTATPWNSSSSSLTVSTSNMGVSISGANTCNVSKSTWDSNTMYISGVITYPGGTTTYQVPITKGNAPYSPPYGTPAGTTSVTSITQTTAYRNATVTSWGAYAGAGTWTWYYGAGNYNTNSGGATNKTLDNLKANTTYNYRFTITNNANKSKQYTNTFKTPAWTPPKVTLNSISNITPTSFRVNYTASGSTVSQFRVYVNGVLWKTVDGSPGYVDITGRSPKTAYSIYIQPWNSNAGWGSNSNTLNATTYPNPVNVSSVWMSNELPFSATANATSNVTADTSGYRFELWNSANTAQLQVRDYNASNTWNITGLTPETTYTVRAYVKTNTSGVISAVKTVTFTTPADQASIWTRVSGTWRKGKVWVRVNNIWQPAKKVYVRVSGAWRGNVNN